MNMKEILEGIDETMNKIEKTAKAHVTNNHTFEDAGLAGFSKAIKNAFENPEVVVEEATNAHTVEKVVVDSVIDVDGKEIKL